jgi:hypothetical protein
MAPASPTPAVATSVPLGWKRFSEGAYSGAIKEGWLAIHLDLTAAGGISLPADVPPAVQTALRQATAGGNLDSIFVVFLDFNPQFATNINSLPCESSAIGKAAGRDTSVYLNVLRSNGITATVVDRVSYRGQMLDMLKASFTRMNDTCQVYLHTDDCFNAVTLSVRPGDTSPLADFKTFLGLLEIDTAKLGSLRP